METNPASWGTHDWMIRRLELAPDQALVQQVCSKCGRAFATNLRSTERYAVHVSVFKLHRLSDEVTFRWLSENCPNQCLVADEGDRQTRVSESARSDLLRS
jgi:hypothetical protein